MSQEISYKFSAIDGLTRIANKISGAVKNVTKKMKGLGNQSKKTEKKVKHSMKGMKKSVSGLLNKMQGLAFGMLAAFGLGKVINAGLEFEDAMVAVSQITGATGKSLDFYSQKVQEVALKHGIASSEIAVALKDIASGKSELLKTPSALVAITDKAAELARATGITVPESVKAMIGSLNMFQQGADMVGSFSDILVKGAQVGASEVGDIAEALKNVGNIAASNNISFLETNALLQAMSKANLKSAEAGTGLAGVLRFIKKKLPKLDIEKMGIQNVLKEIMRLESIGKLDFTKTFGEHEKSILALTANYEFFTQTVKDLNKTANNTTLEAQKKMASGRAKIERMQVRMNQVMIKLFVKMQPLISDMINSFENWMENLSDQDLNNFSDTIDTILSAVKMIGTAFGFILDMLRKIGQVIGEVSAAVVSMDFGQFTGGGKETMIDALSLITPNFGFDMLAGMRGENGETNVKTEIVVSAANGTKVDSVKTEVRKANTKSNMEKL